MERTSLNRCLRNHASKLGIEDYLSVLALQPPQAMEAIDKMSYSALSIYAKFVQEPFLSYNKQGEEQFIPLIALLDDLNPTVKKIQEIHGNVKYLIEVERTVSTTREKLFAMVDSKLAGKTTQQEKVREKIKEVSHGELKTIVGSGTKALNDFLTT